MKIESYSFGELVYEGKTYTSDLIILPDRVIPGWWRANGHLLQMVDLQEVLAATPDVLIIGTGKMGVMKVPAQLQNELRERIPGLVLHVEKTQQAVEIYNSIAPTARTAAALHLTC